MINNDVLRRIRYILNFSDNKMVEVFAQADFKVSNEQICNWLKKDDDLDYEECSDMLLATFLNGLISTKRGKKEGERPLPEKLLTNNLILKKLIIAFSLKSEDTLAIMLDADFPISKHELSSFFRKPGHKHYRLCKDQILRNFLKGLQLKYCSKKE